MSSIDDILQLRPTPPFDFDHTVAALRDFPASPIERRVIDATLAAPLGLRQAWRVGGRPIVLTLRSRGTIEEPLLEVAGVAGLEADERTGLERDLRSALALDVDLRPLERIDDIAFEPVLRALYGYHPLRFPTPFESACWALVQQRTPNAFARASLQRIVDALGAAIVQDGVRFTLFPEPEAFDDAARPALLAATNNVRKVERLVPIAQAFASADPAWLEAAAYDDVRRWLLSIHGLGPWSAEFILTYGLGRFERVAWTDTGAIPAISRVYTPGLTIARGGARERAEVYGWLQGAWLRYVKRYAFTLGMA